MARSVNKVILVGTLGKDPEMRSMPSGSSVANISIATNETWKDKQSGQRQERTEWHRVTLFNRLGEIAGEYLRKGTLVYIEGRLQTRKWQDQNGQDRYTTEIVASEMQMLSGRDNQAGSGDGGGYSNNNSYNNNQGGGYNNSGSRGAPQQPAYNQQNAPNNKPQGGNNPPSDMGMSIDDMDDIPF